MEDDIRQFLSESSEIHTTSIEDDGDDEREDENEDEDEDEFDFFSPQHEDHPSVSVVLPRARYTGICNVETVKDGMSAFHASPLPSC